MPPNHQNGKFDELDDAPPDWHEVDAAEKEKSFHVSLELVFEDDTTPMREGDED